MNEKTQKKNKYFGNLKNREAMVSVEVILSFTVFILVVAGIIYFTNIFIVHNKVQFAINSAAHEIATYTYLYEALGARGAEQTMAKDLGKYAENVDNTVTQVTDTMNEISGLYEKSGKLVDDAKTVNLDVDYIAKVEADAQAVKAAGGATVQSGKETVNKIQGLFEDPGGTVAGIIYMAVDGASYYVKSLGARLAAQVMTKKYMEQGSLSADKFLKTMGVQKGYDGLDFSGSTMFCDEDYRIIDIVVEYDIHLGFLGLIMPTPSVHMIQRCSVSAWVGDNGCSKHSDYLKGIKQGGVENSGKGGLTKSNDKVDTQGLKTADPRGAKLDEENFPDTKFRNFAMKYDNDKDGFLSKDEASKVKSIDMARSGITSLKGIENFTEVTRISCFDNPLTETPDLSQLTKLKHFDSPCMNLDSIDLSNNGPIKEMLESGNYKSYYYNYWGNNSPCVKFYNDKGVALYLDRDAANVTTGNLIYDGSLRFAEIEK